MAAPTVQFIARGIQSPASVPILTFAEGDIAVLFNQSEDAWGQVAFPSDLPGWNLVYQAPAGDEGYQLYMSSILTAEAAETINGHYFTQNNGQDAWYIDVLKISGSSGVIDPGGSSYGVTELSNVEGTQTVTIDTIDPSGPDRLTLLIFGAENIASGGTEPSVSGSDWVDIASDYSDVGDTYASIGLWSATLPDAAFTPTISYTANRGYGMAWFTLTLEPLDSTPPVTPLDNLAINSNDVKAMYFGSKLVKAIYAGNTQIYP